MNRPAKSSASAIFADPAAKAETAPEHRTGGDCGTVMMHVDLSRGVTRRIVNPVRLLLQRFGRVLLVSALGDLRGEYNPAFSLERFVPQLQAALARPVHFIGTNPGPETEAALDRMPQGSVVLIENLRFCPSEQRSPRSFAIRLSCLADHLYIDPEDVPEHAWALELANLLPAAMPHAPTTESN